jgi:SAM-dependent MidA family methyltransferase
MTWHDEWLARAAASETGLPFSAFMRGALYDPERGYYSRPRPIGRGGDFFTGVSVGPCFGHLLARQIRRLREEWAWPEGMDVFEQGAHDGRLSADVLDEAGPGPRWRHRIVEPNPRFRLAQAERLGDRAEIVSSWDDAGPAQGILFANELLDAFPVRRVRFTGGRWREMRVVARDGALAEEAFDADDELRAGEAWAGLPATAPDGFRTELCEEIGPWLDEVGRCLGRGVILVFDYGGSTEERFAPEAADGSLRAYRAHRRILDPFEAPGETDLTADVDFGHVLRSAEARGWRLLGFTDQARFFTGIVAGLPDPDAFPARFRRAFHTLTHPAWMGRRFRVLGLARGEGGPLSALDGFRFGGRRP